MTAPKPAPGKPLTFTPPVFLKGETKPSELPFVESDTKTSKKTKKNKGARPNVVAIDEVKVNVETLTEAIGDANEAIKDFTKSFNKPEVKKPFVLDPHLTQRPFHDDRLMQLKSRLQRPSFKNR